MVKNQRKTEQKAINQITRIIAQNVKFSRRAYTVDFSLLRHTVRHHSNVHLYNFAKTQM